MHYKVQNKKLFQNSGFRQVRKWTNFNGSQVRGEPKKQGFIVLDIWSRFPILQARTHAGVGYQKVEQMKFVK